MNSPAFLSSFTGKALPKHDAASVHNSPRCAMASDSMAPVIKLKQRALSRENAVSVTFEKISVSSAAGDAVISNSALTATLQKKSGVTALPSTSAAPKSSPPAGVSAADFYFPTETRNLAPIISLNDEDMSLSVAYQIVKQEVGGVESTSTKEVPFWKQPKPYKWASSSPSTTSSSTTEPETIETKLFEKYFPSSIRNLAPFIELKAPADCRFNESPSITVGTEFVGFNEKLNKMVVLPDPKTTEELDEDVMLKAAATISKYYPDDRIYKAPSIVIDSNKPSLSYGMEDVEVSDEQGGDFLKQFK